MAFWYRELLLPKGLMNLYFVLASQQGLALRDLFAQV